MPEQVPPEVGTYVVSRDIPDAQIDRGDLPAFLVRERINDKEGRCNLLRLFGGTFDRTRMEAWEGFWDRWKVYPRASEPSAPITPEQAEALADSVTSDKSWGAKVAEGIVAQLGRQATAPAQAEDAPVDQAAMDRLDPGILTEGTRVRSVEDGGGYRVKGISTGQVRLICCGNANHDRYVPLASFWEKYRKDDGGGPAEAPADAKQPVGTYSGDEVHGNASSPAGRVPDGHTGQENNYGGPARPPSPLFLFHLQKGAIEAVRIRRLEKVKERAEEALTDYRAGEDRRRKTLILADPLVSTVVSHISMAADTKPSVSVGRPVPRPADERDWWVFISVRGTHHRARLSVRIDPAAVSPEESALQAALTAAESAYIAACREASNNASFLLEVLQWAGFSNAARYVMRHLKGLGISFTGDGGRCEPSDPETDEKVE